MQPERTAPSSTHHPRLYQSDSAGRILPVALKAGLCGQRRVARRLPGNRQLAQRRRRALRDVLAGYEGTGTPHNALELACKTDDGYVSRCTSCQGSFLPGPGRIQPGELFARPGEDPARGAYGPARGGISPGSFWPGPGACCQRFYSHKRVRALLVDPADSP